MTHEIEQLQRAKMFMDYLANGVDPVTNTDADASTLQNEYKTPRIKKSVGVK